MTGAVEEVGKAAGGIIDSLKSQPLSLALVIMNLALLGFFYFLLTTLAGQRERAMTQLYEDNKTVRDLLSRCIVPGEQKTDFQVPLPLARPIVVDPPQAGFHERLVCTPESPCLKD